MDKQEAKQQELLDLGKQCAAEAKEIRKKYGKTRGQREIPELLELDKSYKEKYLAICEKYK